MADIQTDIRTYRRTDKVICGGCFAHKKHIKITFIKMTMFSRKVWMDGQSDGWTYIEVNKRDAPQQRMRQILFKGLAWRDDPGRQFAWHPILLTLAIVLSKYKLSGTPYYSLYGTPNFSLKSLYSVSRDCIWHYPTTPAIELRRLICISYSIQLTLAFILSRINCV